MLIMSTTGLLTPLEAGDVLVGDAEIHNRALESLRKNGKSQWSYNFYRGLVTEYAHNRAFDRAGIKYGTTHLSDTYDRKVGINLQDDKCALWKDGRIAISHTISDNEMKRWQNEAEDVIIHSFTQVSPDSLDSMYHGAISFRKLVQKKLICLSKTSHTGFYFPRQQALSLCLAT
jgi:hypothetical protein